MGIMLDECHYDFAFIWPSSGDDAQLPCSLVLAYESSEVLTWLGRNAGRMAACHLDVEAVASRSSIELMSADGPAQPLSCTGYRIDL